MARVCPKRGVIPPLVTPLAKSGELDSAALDRIIERIVQAGADGVFALGTTGEAPSLSHAMRFEIVRRVCELAGGRVPVLVGVTDTSLEEAVELAVHAHQCGSSAIVAAPPFYFPVSQDELFEFMKALAAASPLPLFLYNFPAMTKITFELDTLKRLARLPNVAGLKDSSGDLDYFRAALHAVADVEDFAVFMGPEEMMAEGLHLGAAGGVTGGANLFPDLFVGLYRAVIEGRAEDERRLQARLMEISAKIYELGGYGSGFLRSIKAAMSICGLCENVLAPPHLPLTKAQCERLRARLEEMGLLTPEGEPALRL